MKLNIAFSGDIMPGAIVGEYIQNATVSDWLGGVSSAWSDADLLVGNLECPHIVKATPIKGKLPELTFHAPASRLAELADAGFSAVTLANNHILDCGSLGLLETIRGLNRVGIYHAGAGKNLDAALQPAFIPVRDLMVGLVAFCYGPSAGRTTPGVAPSNRKMMRRALSSAREGADIVIAVLHDGLEYSDVPPTSTRAKFCFLAENGADIVVGHHPHVLQGLEWHNDVPIAYSLGDLLFQNSLPHVAERNFSRIAMGQYAPEEVRRDPGKFSRGAVLIIEIAGSKKLVEWHPFRQDPSLRPQLCLDDARIEALGRLADLSSALSNRQDPRHELANFVLDSAWWNDRANLKTRQLLKLALRPKWRYFPTALKWFYRRVSGAT